MSKIEVLQNRFWSKLDESNTSKEKDTPVAVVIKAKHDFNGIFSAAPTQSLLLQIAKTHRVVIKTIEDSRQFGRMLRETSQELQKGISLLVVMAHSYPDRIQFGRDTFCCRFMSEPFYRRKHIVREDFASLTEHAKIILYACATGQSIAQDIANISKRTTYAPTEILCDTKTCLQNWPNQEIKMVSYDDKNQQHMQSFTPNSPPSSVSLSEMGSEENRASFSEVSEYLKEAACKGDANAQWKLGMTYLLGIGTCPKSEEKAAYWLSLAAEQGIAQAQFELGNMYFLGATKLERSENKAGALMTLAARQGFPPALFQMGMFYLNGKCGFKASDEKAARFFSLAAQKGLPEALFNLAVLYEHGRGVRRSLSYARHLYDIVEGLGLFATKDKRQNFNMPTLPDFA